MRKNSVKVTSLIGDENKIGRRPNIKRSTGFSTGVLSDITNIKKDDQLKKIKVSSDYLYLKIELFIIFLFIRLQNNHLDKQKQTIHWINISLIRYIILFFIFFLM